MADVGRKQRGEIKKRINIMCREEIAIAAQKTGDVVAALVEKGVTIVTPVSEAPGGWSADFLDPDGFGLGLYQSEAKPRSLKKK